MKQFLKRLSFKKDSPPLKKESHVGSLIACNTVGKPVWTPKSYDRLSEEGYKKNVIVYRAVNLISRGIASVPWRLYLKEKELKEHPLLSLLHAPSPREAGSCFMESVVSYLLLSGNAYIESVLSPNGHPQELHPLRPDRVKVIPGKGGLVTGYDYTVNGRTQRLKAQHFKGGDRLLHLKLFNPLNDWYGMSPIEAAACSIDQHNTVAGHNLALLQNGGRPSGALVVGHGSDDIPMTEEQRHDLRSSLKDLYEGSKNAGRVLVLEGDFKWEEMGLSPRDLDFVEGKKMSAREISQAYGVPPMLVGVPGDATFSNYREARYHLWEDTILPLLDHIIDEFNTWLAPQFGSGLKLDYDIDAIPALAPRREEAWSKFSKANFLTVNEKRQAMGYPPLSNGDTL